MDKYYRLVERLIAQTESGQLNWEKTVAQNAFQVPFNKHTVRIAQSIRDEDSEHQTVEVVVFIRNQSGQTVDRFDDAELKDAFPGTWGTSSSFERMSHLYRLAQRNAMGAEAALDDILDQLGGDESSPV